jgi:hypothetical protein
VRAGAATDCADERRYPLPALCWVTRPSRHVPQLGHLGLLWVPAGADRLRDIGWPSRAIKSRTHVSATGSLPSQCLEVKRSAYAVCPK